MRRSPYALSAPEPLESRSWSLARMVIDSNFVEVTIYIISISNERTRIVLHHRSMLLKYLYSQYVFLTLQNHMIY